MAGRSESGSTDGVTEPGTLATRSRRSLLALVAWPGRFVACVILSSAIGLGTSIALLLPTEYAAYEDVAWMPGERVFVPRTVLGRTVPTWSSRTMDALPASIHREYRTLTDRHGIAERGPGGLVYTMPGARWESVSSLNLVNPIENSAHAVLIGGSLPYLTIVDVRTGLPWPWLVRRTVVVSDFGATPTIATSTARSWRVQPFAMAGALGVSFLVSWMAVSAARLGRVVVRLRRGRCPACAHDVRAAPSGVCSECGFAVASRGR